LIEEALANSNKEINQAVELNMEKIERVGEIESKKNSHKGYHHQESLKESKVLSEKNENKMSNIGEANEKSVLIVKISPICL
jgi:hypothetical protein